MFEPKTLRHFEHELRTMLKAAADQDPEGLVDLERLLRSALEEGVPQAAEEARRRNGFSWAQFGKAFGTSAWAVQKRFAKGLGGAAAKTWIA